MKTSIFLVLSAICLCLGMLLVPLSAQAAQKCNEAIRATRPDREFLIHDDGTVTDQTTGLMWMRCALGQEFQGGRCRGTATLLSWNQALKGAESHEFAGFSDWRLPNKNELGSLLEERCVVPSLNVNIFPGTPPAFFWTSSPYAGLTTAAWSVDFGYGTLTATEKTGKINVRLVRNGD